MPGGLRASCETKAVSPIHLTVWESGIIHPDDSLIQLATTERSEVRYEQITLFRETLKQEGFELFRLLQYRSDSNLIGPTSPTFY